MSPLAPLNRKLSAFEVRQISSNYSKPHSETFRWMCQGCVGVFRGNLPTYHNSYSCLQDESFGRISDIETVTGMFCSRFVV